MNPHPKYEAARAAIEAVHGDTSVSPEVTRDALMELSSDIDGFVMAINEGLANAGGADDEGEGAGA